jgi:hypothetical protein
VLELIKGLNLPLDKLKVTVKETQNDQA